MEQRGFKSASVFVRILPENEQEKKYKIRGIEKYERGELYILLHRNLIPPKFTWTRKPDGGLRREQMQFVAERTDASEIKKLAHGMERISTNLDLWSLVFR